MSEVNSVASPHSHKVLSVQWMMKAEADKMEWVWLKPVALAIFLNKQMQLDGAGEIVFKASKK